MIKDLLQNIDINLDHVDENIKKTILALLNIIEMLARENDDLRQQVQTLKNEINRLKGEQGKPTIRPNVKKKERWDISSEKERPKEKKPHKKRKKNQHIKIHHRQKCTIDKSKLPADAEFKGYKDVVVQGLKIEPYNTLFKKEIYYSASEKKTYIAKLPRGYKGSFNPCVRSFIIIFKNVCNMSQAKIVEFLQTMGISISEGTVSNILIKDTEPFHQEKKEIT